MIAGNRFTALSLGWLMLGAPAQAHAQRDLSSVLAEIDQGFVCPQFRPDEAARRADMLAFSRAIASVGPKKISYRQAAYIHARMLERHNCAGGSNATMASTEPSVSNGAPAPLATPPPAAVGLPH